MLETCSTCDGISCSQAAIAFLSRENRGDETMRWVPRQLVTLRKRNKSKNSVTRTRKYQSSNNQEAQNLRPQELDDSLPRGCCIYVSHLEREYYGPFQNSPIGKWICKYW